MWAHRGGGRGKWSAADEPGPAGILVRAGLPDGLARPGCAGGADGVGPAGAGGVGVRPIAGGPPVVGLLRRCRAGPVRGVRELPAPGGRADVATAALSAAIVAPFAA